MSNYNSTLQNNNTDLQAILDTINELPEAGSGGDGDVNLQASKTVDPTTTSQTVTPDSGYDGLEKVIVNAIPTATQATPSISVGADGLITATASQTAGYVASGSKSATKQLAFQPAKTITPSTASQIAVSSGYYTGGNITVAPIPSQYVIPSGTSNITANGTYDVKNYANVNVKVEGGADYSAEDGLISGTLTSYANDRVTIIRESSFKYCTELTTVSLANAVNIFDMAFCDCESLTTINLPKAQIIGYNAFANCFNLTSICFPSCFLIVSYAFESCYNLKTAYFPKLT